MRKLGVLIVIMLSTFVNSVFSLQNHVGVHDPSSIIKEGNTYWIFTTGDGIYSCNSTDLIKWTKAATPFTKTVFPSWIKTYVSDFAGHFWAPECFYMNGKYHLYYSCSSFGKNTSAIGLATSPSLNNPSWTDQGMVVFSNSTKTYNTIDPDIFYDFEGKLWMTFGSWFSGIQMTQLDTLTGKPIKDSMINICNFKDPENSQIIKNENFYYLFVNRGLCCKGASSTYYIQVARSTSPTGPYTDWRTVLSTTGNFVGPGATGHFVENGIEYVSYHYYDSYESGNAKLAIGRMQWSNGWPKISLQWFDDNIYRISNVNSNLYWSTTNCSADTDVPLVQSVSGTSNCQRWYLKYLGNGFYNINSAKSILTVRTNECFSTNGEKLQLTANTGAGCQIWKIERNNVGKYIISSKSSNRIVEIANASKLENASIVLNDFDGNDAQKWNFETTTKGSDTLENITNLKVQQTSFEIFPNPTKSGDFSINIDQYFPNKSVTLEIYDTQNKMLFCKKLTESGVKNVSTGLKSGLYLVRIYADNVQCFQKLLVQ